MDEPYVRPEVETATNIDDIHEYMKGKVACRNGEECPVGAGPAFIRGYSSQYEADQIMSELGVGSYDN